MVQGSILKILSLFKIPQNFNLRILKIFMAVAMVGNIVVIARNINYHNYVFPFHFQVNYFVILTLLIIWSISSFILIFKPHIVVLTLINLLLCGFIDREIITYGIFEYTHLLVSWFALFVSIIINNYSEQERLKYQLGVLGFFFSLVYFGFVFFYAGFTKMLDPLWIYGGGFKNFIQLEWVTSSWLRTLFLENNWLMFLGNYTGLIGELLFLPLFLIPKTRKISFYFFAVIGIQLLFPFNVFMIGYFATTTCISIYCFANGKGLIILRKHWSTSLMSIIYFVLFSTFIYSMYDYKNMYDIENTTNKVYNSPEEASIEFSIKELKNHYYSPLNEFYYYYKFFDLTSPFKFFTNRFFRTDPIALFSGNHSVGVFGYRIIYNYGEKDQMEPIKYFNKNGGRGDFDSQILQTNIFQGSMYSYTDLLYSVNQYENESFRRDFGFTLKYYYNLIIGPIINFTNKKSSITNYKSITFLVKSLGKDCPSSKWETFIIVKNDKIKVNFIPTESCVQGRNPLLKNYYIKNANFKSLF